MPVIFTSRKHLLSVFSVMSPIAACRSAPPISSRAPACRRLPSGNAGLRRSTVTHRILGLRNPGTCLVKHSICTRRQKLWYLASPALPVCRSSVQSFRCRHGFLSSSRVSVWGCVLEGCPSKTHPTARRIAMKRATIQREKNQLAGRWSDSFIRRSDLRTTPALGKSGRPRRHLPLQSRTARVCRLQLNRSSAGRARFHNRRERPTSSSSFLTQIRCPPAGQSRASAVPSARI